MSTPGLGSKLRKVCRSRDMYRTIAAKFAYLLATHEGITDEADRENYAARLLAGAVDIERRNMRRDPVGGDDQPR